jgi:hypothetical protein
MAPVIRIDDEVMGKLKEHAVSLGLVFGTPNEVLRRILALDCIAPTKHDAQTIEVHLRTIYTPRRFALIPIPKGARRFLPGYKVNFELVTDVGTINTHVTSAPKGAQLGDPDAGVYIQGGLRSWYDSHPELEDGAKLLLKALEPGIRYELAIARTGERRI